MRRSLFLKALLGLSIFPKAIAASDKKFNEHEDIFKLGAKGDGRTNDTEAFREWFKRHESLRLPEGKNFVLGDLELDGKSLIGPGSVTMKSGSKSAVTLKGNSSRILNVDFKGNGTGRRPEAHVLLGPGIDHAIIDGCSFSGGLFNAIGCGVNSEKDKSLDASELRNKITISNNQFKGRYSHHLYLHQIDNLIITDNYFENSSHDSIRLRQMVKTITISQNQFRRIGLSKDGDSRDAIDCFWSGHQLIVSDNHFEDVTVHGIDLKGHSPDLEYGSSKVNITGNQFRRIGFSGILVSSGDKIAGEWKAIRNINVASNQFEGCGYLSNNPNDAALFLRHNQEMIIIHGNQFYDNFNKGVMIGNFAVGAPVSKNIIIQSNLFSSNGRPKNAESYGIHVLGGKSIIITGNIISNDSIQSNHQHHKGVVVEKYNNYLATEIINQGNIENLLR
jgi:hypothetical protein